ncbi:hypothetical protein GCM10007859_25570 [Brevundimonas denitrificans]|uniref:Uncharacterized protein n=1 Tax=Brevundimonas denitrificans TaxID=1443434 RepID=A0ABQ6BKQ4_9CAUL|nr:hypothetical protein GCM10007859_25570 [Brevundimonas denitrificans]
MRISPNSTPVAQGLAVQLTQMTCRVAAHRSSPTTRPVESPGAITDDTAARRPSRHTFDIRV